MSIFNSFFSAGLSFPLLRPAGCLVVFADMVKRRVVWLRGRCE